MTEATTKVSEKYVENLPEWPDFDVYDKTIDGLIPVCRLRSWEDIALVVREYFKDDGEEFIFRGQQNFRWFLESTLDRLTEGAIKEEVAEKQLRNFKLSIRGRVKDGSIVHENVEELWAIGQHHGLATPLLDWTAAPYVALFFAFMHEDPPLWKDKMGNPTNHSRSLFVINKTFLDDLKDSELNGYPRIIEPAKDDHGRLVNQAGLFTISPYGETLESSLIKALDASGIDTDDPNELAKYMCKIHIPNSVTARTDCLRQLRKMNIHYGSIFPDLIGASGYCNELIKEFIDRSSKVGVPSLVPIATPTVTAEPLRAEPATLISAPLADQLLKAALAIPDIAEKLPGSVLEEIIKIALHFVDTSAGVDWYKRESQIARLKNMLRRIMSRYGFGDELTRVTVDTLTSSAAQAAEARDAAANAQQG